MIERSWVRVPAGTAGEFLLQGQLSVLALISVSVPSLRYLPQSRGHSAESTGGKLQLNTFALTYAASNEVIL